MHTRGLAIDFQLGVMLDSILFPDICNSGSDIKVHCSGESVLQVGEFINCSFTVIVLLVYDLCFFVLIQRS